MRKFSRVNVSRSEMKVGDSIKLFCARLSNNSGGMRVFFPLPILWSRFECL